MLLPVKKRKVIKLILVLTLIKSLAWALFVPMWHFPDEQAHFGHVAYLAEGGTLPMGRSNDLNQEIAISEQRLGTYRNKYGNNSFTYNPGFNLEYTENFTGKFEEEIKTLPLNLRQEYKDPESAYYPHFFYRVSGFIYRLFYQQDLFVRVFATRIFWLFTHLLMVYWAYLIGKIIFPQDRLASVSVAVLTSFQPMLSFVAAGVTSDNLHNALFTGAIYFCLKIWQRPDPKFIFGLALVSAMGFINKPQFLIAMGIIIPVVTWSLIKMRKFKLMGLFIFGFSALALVFGRDYVSGLWDSVRLGQLPFFSGNANQARPDYSLGQHAVYTAQHTFREVLPWYWGVFRWLSLTLPRWVNQVLMRLLLAGGMGLMIKIFKRKFEPGLGLIIWSAAVYFLALFFWDFRQVQNAGFPFGIQGRYYFPVLVPHMVLLVIGLKTLWSKLLLPLSLWFIGLNWLAFYWLTASYYSVNSFKTFIIQASQYKPEFAKGWWLAAALLLYAVMTLILAIKLVKNER